MEWQIRSWPYFVWLSGGHFVEQHLHNIDIINRAIGTHPLHCLSPAKLEPGPLPVAPVAIPGQYDLV